MDRIQGKRILLGVSGGIAIYKSLSLLSLLNKRGAETEVIMTDGAKEFVTPMTFQTMSKHRVYDSIFSDEDGFIPHIDLTRRNDVFLIAPATANVIAKIAHGIADDLLSSAALASNIPIIISPAMNVYMYNNPSTQANLNTLKERGIQVIEPGSGWLACNEIGAGRMPEAEELTDILDSFFNEKDLVGKKIMVTGGATRERIDPVRFLTNDSSGKQGLAIAKRALKRGADVFFLHGHISVDVPEKIPNLQVDSTEDLLEAVMKYLPDYDALIMAAAPSDYKPVVEAEHKLKKEGDGGLTLVLTQTPDILREVANIRSKDQTIIGFAAETERVLEYGRRKLEEKKLDYIICNDVSKKDSGFNSNQNTVTILGDDYEKAYPSLNKEVVADKILDLLR